MQVPDPTELTEQLRQKALDAGFVLFGVAPAVTPPGYSDFRSWLERGFAGEMSWMERRADAYSHPEHVLPEVRSVVMLATNYKSCDPVSGTSTEGRVSRYAWGATDYHDLLRSRMRGLSNFLRKSVAGSRSRGVVDTAPLLERDFARLAGLGWFGKNTLLINRWKGSWVFLSALLTTVELISSVPHESAHCGTCTRCLEACPTDAFPEPYVLDARKCIAYLNIELRDQPIPFALRDGMGEWLFGCDICQDVCPWNRKAPADASGDFESRQDLRPADCIALLDLGEEQFARRFRGTPLERTGRNAVLRNAAIVLGNSADVANVPALSRAARDTSPLVRGAAVWALGRTGGANVMAVLIELKASETDEDVLHEFNAALSTLDQVDMKRPSDRFQSEGLRSSGRVLCDHSSSSSSSATSSNVVRAFSV